MRPIPSRISLIYYLWERVFGVSWAYSYRYTCYEISLVLGKHLAVQAHLTESMNPCTIWLNSALLHVILLMHIQSMPVCGHDCGLCSLYCHWIRQVVCVSNTGTARSLIPRPSRRASRGRSRRGAQGQEEWVFHGLDKKFCPRCWYTLMPMNIVKKLVYIIY